MHTEEAARKLWCPFARIANVDVDDRASWNRFSGAEEQQPSEALCIASECMAWRWDYSGQVVVAKGNNPLVPLGGPKKEKGYCGLAGKP